MKKFLMLACFIMLTTLVTKAQVNLPASYGQALSVKDTLIDVDVTSTVVTTVPANKVVLTFQINATKISGTVAGTINIYGSIDNGANYVLVTTDTLTNTSGTKSYGYTYSSLAYKKYKCEVITSGTVHVAVQRWAYYQ